MDSEYLSKRDSLKRFNHFLDVLEVVVIRIVSFLIMLFALAQILFHKLTQ